MRVRINQKYLTALSLVFLVAVIAQYLIKGDDVKSFVASAGIIKTESAEEEFAHLLSAYSEDYLERYRRDTAMLGMYNYSSSYIPVFPVETYTSRLDDIENEIPLTYNSDVRGFINLYFERKRPLASRIIGRSYTYFPMFEEVLREKGLPQELKYLAVVESALNPDAESWAGAVGMWQFMAPTAREYKMTVNKQVDERKDPAIATRAAAEYLEDLYRMYDDWGLAIAAYNAGPGNVNKAIRRAGLKGKNPTFWKVKRYLPRETQSYFPAFIAANYIMNYYTAHNLRAIDPKLMASPTDQILITENTTFHDLAEELEMSPEELAYFNPQFEKNGKVEVTESAVSLVLPEHIARKFKTFKATLTGNKS